MADNKTPLRIDLVKNSNQKSDYFGHYYGRVVRVATLSTRAFAQHIAEHGSIYTLDIVMGVLRKLTDCLIEQLAEREARRHRNVLPHGEEREGRRSHHRRRQGQGRRPAHRGHPRTFHPRGHRARRHHLEGDEEAQRTAAPQRRGNHQDHRSRQGKALAYLHAD